MTSENFARAAATTSSTILTTIRTTIHTIITNTIPNPTPTNTTAWLHLVGAKEICKVTGPPTVLDLSELLGCCDGSDASLLPHTLMPPSLVAAT
eukprot:CAMPEP_0172735350 /NCGR_PEP_ID=MMETSP1074-20121228/112347_1 /TAXON_ID=2916 /ORGANISM="Ceratium fusus, Strain PA161109" /LENGTH=93 /DNA_ID=CAMNT_0013564333 /DNA_START=66 /DNA_END=348 /DNA_ORIENTATION=-